MASDHIYVRIPRLDLIIMQDVWDDVTDDVAALVKAATEARFWIRANGITGTDQLDNALAAFEQEAGDAE